MILDKLPFNIHDPSSLAALVSVILIVAIAVLWWKYRNAYWKSIPSSRRDDLVYGYYSSLENTYEQVKDHVNLFWHSHFFSTEKFIEILKGTNAKIVLDLAPFVSERNADNKLVYKQNARDELRGYFNILNNNGVLSKITYLYPSDEPNLFVLDEQNHLEMIRAVKDVAKEFEGLKNARYAIIYGRGKDFWNIGEFDVVGVDDYGQRSSILTVGEHARLKKHMLPHQKTFLVPGPAFGHCPKPFVAYALRNPTEVEGVIPFIWFDHPDHKDVKYKGLEARSKWFRKLWIKAAQTCLNK